MRLNNKIAVVTGGASGLGLEIAVEFAAEGAVVVIADVNLEAARNAASGIRGATAMALDVSDPESVRQLVDAVIEQHGRIDILVNSAGVAKLRPFLEMDIEDFDRITAVNLRGTFLIGQSVARTMTETGGIIINLASASGRRGSYGRCAYGPSKAGVILLTQVMAVELAEFDIRVNGIAPGPIETPIVAELPPAGRASWTNVVPMARFGQPKEIARAAVFLASEDSSYMTGTTLDVDGGYASGGILKT